MLWRSMQGEPIGATRMQWNVSQARLEAPERLCHASEKHFFRGVCAPILSSEVRLSFGTCGSRQFQGLIWSVPAIRGVPLLSPCIASGTSEKGTCLSGTFSIDSSKDAYPLEHD